MIYGSVCSGIEAATVAWHPLGWTPAWFSENDKFPSKVLKYHYPTVPNLGDMTKIRENEIYKKSTLDVFVGGTPCQDFSIAGLREGLGGDRGDLTLEYCRILKDKQPLWFVWENVPGAFSSFTDEEGSEIYAGAGREDGHDCTQTNDLATVLAAFRECGYSCAWRVLDSRYFGVPQRRQRIFVVGYLGNDWRAPYAVLFEPEGVRGDIKKGRKKGQEIAGTLNARTGGGGFPGSDESMNGYVQPFIEPLTGRPYSDNGDSSNLMPCWWDGGQTSQTLDAVLSKGQMMPEKNRFPAVLYANMPEKVVEADVTQPLPSQDPFRGDKGDVVYQLTQITSKINASNPKEGDPAPSLAKGNAHNMVVVPRVRRLTPLECERLQGFPDNYTNIPGASDTVRYRSIGNSMTTHVMAWIGSRIDKVDRIMKSLKSYNI